MTAFPLAEVLSVTTGVLVSDIGGVYRVLDFMTGESLVTHQLPRASDEAAPVILDRHPELLGIQVPAWVKDHEAAARWVAAIAEQIGAATIDLEPLTVEDHTPIDPIAEIRMMRPDLPIISTVVEGGER